MTGSPELLAALLLPWLYGDASLADSAVARRASRGLAESAGRVSAATLRRSAAGLRAWSGTRVNDLGKISAPTLVLAGERDLLTPDAEALAAAIPGARLVVVPGAGHALAIEAAGAVGTALLAHLAR